MSQARIRWLKPDVRCPNCGAPPAYRITPGDRTLAYTYDPSEPVHSAQCSVEWCKTIYVVTARAHQTAA